MARRNYEKLTVEAFGRQLITTGDLDPVYVMLVGTQLEEPQLARWLIAYWCLYHCGSASYISEAEGAAFWERLMEAATNLKPNPLGGRWPRGHERRHFRGRQGYASVYELSRAYPTPEKMIQFLAQPTADGLAQLPFQTVADRAQTHRGFGPWMAFKIADMLERVLGVSVDFDQSTVFMFKDPVKAALMLWRQRMDFQSYVQPNNRADVLNWVVGLLQEEFKDLKAPPTRDRPIGVQEIETVLCKHKSHLSGHYPLWNDTDEISAGLNEWSRCSETAGLLLKHLPEHSV